MCIDFEGHHSDGSPFVYVSDILILLLKKTTGKESQYMVSHPELGSDPPIGSDQESGCDNHSGESSQFITLKHLFTARFL